MSGSPIFRPKLTRRPCGSARRCHFWRAAAASGDCARAPQKKRAARRPASYRPTTMYAFANHRPHRRTITWVAKQPSGRRSCWPRNARGGARVIVRIRQNGPPMRNNHHQNAARTVQMRDSPPQARESIRIGRIVSFVALRAFQFGGITLALLSTSPFCAVPHQQHNRLELNPGPSPATGN